MGHAKIVVAFLPARPDTAYWDNNIAGRCCIKGFGGAMDFSILRALSTYVLRLTPCPAPRCPLAKPRRRPSTASATGGSTTRPSCGGDSLTVWVDQQALDAWNYRGPSQWGAQYVYSDAAIQCLLTIRAVFHLPLRATQGMAPSVFEMMGSDLDVPHYSTLSRRVETHVADTRIANDEFQVALPKRDRGGINNADDGENSDPITPHLETLRKKIHRHAQSAVSAEFHHNAGEQH